ncbi:EamA family transporter RarD [Prolixibacteraceae bacterium JC049]|nr:EamA family transporter RarD [Prolixibacteraceae bacterium JC049]
MELANETKRGYGYTVIAFLSWGVLPIYWKWLKEIPAWEILAHRIFWSFVFVVLILIYRKKLKLKQWLSDKKAMKALVVTALLVGSNWGVYIYAVNADRIVEASLGYYITPLVNVALGMLLLNEKLDRLKMVALILAALAVVYLTIDYGKFPWLSIYLAFSFGFYGLLKKTSGVEAMPALAVETLILTPLAIVFIGMQWFNDSGALFTSSLNTHLLLIGTGVVTTLPLLWFGLGAQRIPLSSVGFIQYIGPSLMLLIGIVLYKEPFRYEQIIAFSLIWLALGFYSYSMIKNRLQKKK